MRWLKKRGVNRIVLVMVYADLLLISATGFISPIIAVFLTTQIRGATIATVGFVTTLFWVVKSAFQIPVAAYVDSKRGERDDYQMMVAGCVVTAVCPLLYYFFASEIWHVFAIETLNGIGYAMSVPTYLAIFTRHIDKHRESSEWTLHSNAIGLGFAAAAAMGGVLADRFGFRVLFLLVSAFTFLGVVALLAIKDDIMDGDRREKVADGIGKERESIIR
jgi:MFS family permease